MSQLSLLRSVIDSSPSGLLLVDADGRIVLVNREVERLFGYLREELLGRPVDLLLPERYRQGHSGFRGAFMQDPRTRAMGAGRDLFGLRKDGVEVPVEIGLTPLVTGEGVHVLSAIVDISSKPVARRSFARDANTASAIVRLLVIRTIVLTVPRVTFMYRLVRANASEYIVR